MKESKKPSFTREPQNENGNALWFILIAVVLMGLLTMTLSRGGSSTDQTGDFEQLRIQAGEILRYAKSLEAAVQDLQLRGISENDISFENDITATDYTNPNCDDTNDRSFPGCLIFDIEGAGLTYKAPNSKWLSTTNTGASFYGEWLFTGNTCIPSAGDISGAECAASPTRKADLILILPYINLALCKHINNLVNLPTTTSNPPSDDVNAWSTSTPEFTGTFGDAMANLADSPLEDLRDASAGCFAGDSTPPTGTFHFFYILKRRE